MEELVEVSVVYASNIKYDSFKMVFRTGWVVLADRSDAKDGRDLQ